MMDLKQKMALKKLSGDNNGDSNTDATKQKESAEGTAETQSSALPTDTNTPTKEQEGESKTTSTSESDSGEAGTDSTGDTDGSDSDSSSGNPQPSGLGTNTPAFTDTVTNPIPNQIVDYNADADTREQPEYDKEVTVTVGNLLDLHRILSYAVAGSRRVAVLRAQKDIIALLPEGTPIIHREP